MQLEQTTALIPAREELDNQRLVVPKGYVLSDDGHIPLHPRGDYTTGHSIVAALGSFWSEQFADRGQLLGLQRASSIMVLQGYMTYLESLAAMSRFSCPIFHRRVWYVLILRESKMNTGKASMLKYGGGAVYDGFYRYGDLIGNRFEEVALDTLRDVSMLTNRILDPSVAWVRELDFTIDQDALLLRDDPFEDGRFPVTNILDSAGNIIDRETVIWAFDTREDWEHLYQHYGYAIRIKTLSSSSYRDLINAVWNGLVGGPSVRDLEWALAALAGLPTVMETQEVVEAILIYPEKLVIATDQHSYIYPADSIPRFMVGDVVRARQVLVDTVQVFDLASFDDVQDLLTSQRFNDAGQAVTRYTLEALGPSSSSSLSAGGSGSVYLNHRQPSKIKPGLASSQVPLLEVLPLTIELLGPGYGSPIGFRNEVGSFDDSILDDDGVPRGRIHTVVGAESDVDKFWNDAHVRGLEEGATWLQLTESPRPVYVNPAGWIIENFLSNHALVIYLRYARFGADAIGMQVTELLRDVSLPEKLLLYVLDLEAEESPDAPTELAENIPVGFSDETAAPSDAEPRNFYASLCA